jgi:3-phenylpropionate/cinnamic acid dioxygenase small subunit
MHTTTLSPAPEQLRVAEQLIDAYVRGLDRLEVTRWPEYFATEASYIVTSRENLERGLQIAHILDDSRGRIEDRITYITKVWDGHYNEYWPRHVLGRSIVTDVVGDDIRVETNFAIYMSEPGEVGSRLFAVGYYDDVITVQDGEAKFKSKTVVLDTTVLPRYFVYPL